MHVADLQLPLSTIFTPQVVRWTVWVGLVGLTVALLVLMRTGWGQSQPLRKCIVLSLVAHLLVGIYATTVNIVTGGGGGPGNQAVTVSLLDGAESQAFAGPGELRPWDKFSAGEAEPLDVVEPEPVALPEDEPAADLRPEDVEPELPREIVEPVLPDRAPDEPNIPQPPDEPLIARSVDKSVEAIDVPPPPATQADEPEIETPSTPDADLGPDATKTTTSPPADESTHEKPAKGSSTKPIKPLADTSADTTGDGPAKGRPAKSQLSGDRRPESRPAGGGDVPSAYKNRFAPNHAGIAQQNGGSKQTEAAVTAALKWLADNQSSDGRWNARKLEAGREVMIHGHDRRGAGSQADTGVTGLALLAFLAAGNTHERGEHRETVRRGLEFLLRIQAADGSIGGDATLFEKMYCHAMATFAMSEAFAMSRDARLESSARKAVDYCIGAQHRPSGGWRYQPGEAGDTSQLGWQVMALKSAELAGIRIPDTTREGMIRYLNSVSSGPHKGLASYRPGHAATRPMTAEALVCRQFLGMARTNPAADEAGDYLLAELPGKSEANLYYWYYATLGMYQLQGDHWQRWNEALQPALVLSQRDDGRLAGSWDPDAVWGAYGGRVFSTALSTLCLEVYYRYLLQDPTASRDNRVK